MIRPPHEAIRTSVLEICNNSAQYCGDHATMLTQLYQILLRRAEHFPRSIAIGAQEGRARGLVAGLSADLAQRGVQAGDRVVLWAPSGLRTPIYLFALWKLGAMVVPF